MTITSDRTLSTTSDDRSFDSQTSAIGAPLSEHPSHHISPHIRRIFTEGGLVFIVGFGLYLTVAILLDFHYRVFDLDATSRLANGFYVLYSRDPHLAAIGFVWNPGTSIADLIPLLFYHLWTPLATHMFAASIVSALAMAGAIYQVRSALVEWGVDLVPRMVLTVLLALNGMILLYGGNGMSEGLYLFTLLATSRYLLRWLRTADLASLVYAAISLGLCYLVRNEAIGPALLAGALVLTVTYLRGARGGKSEGRSHRIWSAMTDLVIFEIPVFTAFLGWAVASYVITGQPFQQFTSSYGTTSQIKLEGSAVLKARILQDVHDVFYLSPGLPLLIVIALVLAARRRDIGVLAPMAVIGGALAFDLLAYIHNSIQPWFRYFICAVPLGFLLVASFFATSPAQIDTGIPGQITSQPTRRRGLKALGAVFVTILILVPSNVMTIVGMSKPKIGYEETENLGFIFSSHPTAYEKEAPKTYPAMQRISSYFVDKKFDSGQVIVDNFSVCVPMIIAMSSNPHVFVIPNDRTYQRTLDDPLTFHAHYILDPDPVGLGSLASTNVQYPRLWKTGGGFTTVVHTFPAKGACPEFKLFRVTGHPSAE